MTASVFGDPGDSSGAVFAVQGPESTWKGYYDVGGTDVVVRYDGTYGSSTLLRAMVGRHAESLSYGGGGVSAARFVDYTVGADRSDRRLPGLQRSPVRAERGEGRPDAVPRGATS